MTPICPTDDASRRLMKTLVRARTLRRSRLLADRYGGFSLRPAYAIGPAAVLPIILTHEQKMSIEQALLERAEHQCELCNSSEVLSQFEVPSEVAREDANIVICAVCAAQIAEDDASALDSTHWYCLQGSIWSEVRAVKVLSWRMLNRLSGETWARDLLDQAYLTEESMEWAKEGMVEASSDAPPTLDSNGTPLSDGDDVTLVRNLDVKGTDFVAKQGTRVKGIRLIDGDPENVDGRVNGIMLVLKTKFLKKA